VPPYCLGVEQIRRHGRELGRLAAGAAIGAPAPLLLLLVVASVPMSAAGGLGLGLFAAVVWVTRRLAARQRRRARAALGATVPSPYRPLPAGPFARLNVVLRDPATWRDLAWLPCQFVAGTGTAVVLVGCGSAPSSV